jgi:hypothetical protein
MHNVLKYMFGQLKVRFPYLNSVRGSYMHTMLNNFPEGLDGPNLNEMHCEQAEQEAHHLPCLALARAGPVPRDSPGHIRLRGWER